MASAAAASKASSAKEPEPKERMVTKSPENENTVCRDFLRNVCNRGARCKFSHDPNNNNKDENIVENGNNGGNNGRKRGNPRGPNKSSNKHKCNENVRRAWNESMQDSIVFCHDFENGSECSRQSCRFVHASREEAARFRSSAYLSPRAREQCLSKAVGADMGVHFGRTPVCKEHLGGGCRRSHCKFRHISPMQHDLELNYYLMHSDGSRRRHNNGFEGQQIAPPFHESFDYMGNDEQRRRTLDFDNGRSADMLEQENLLLKQRVEELKKQVSDLSTTNEFLLEQNAQLRIKSSGAHVVVSAASAAQPGVSMAVQAMPAISIAATPAVQQAIPPAAPLTMSAATVEPIPAASYSIAAAVEDIRPAGQPGRPTAQSQANAALTAAPTLANAAVVCHAPELSSANPPVSSVHHVQETRLVSYPVTSIRQGL